MKTMDGNEACAFVAYEFTEVAGIYPITPSSPMAEKTDEWAAAGKKNMFGQPVTLIEMQSEAGAVGTMHGSLEAGALATTYTSSQGLMLMIPCMHIISGHRHPAVFHVASRSVGTHANSIFGDHQDVMDCRSTGVAIFSSGSVQEVMDLAALPHLAAIRSRIPFLHFFDGFRTSHEIQKIEVIDMERVRALLDVDALERWRALAQNPEHPVIRTTVQSSDVYFQNAEASNPHYSELPGIVEEYLGKLNEITGREYHIFSYYGAPDAERVVIGMGSVGETAREVVDCLIKRGEKVGYLSVHLYRPFSVKHFLAAIPETASRIAVLDRYRDPGSVGEALYVDVCAAFANESRHPRICGGRYGLSSKDVTPAQVKAVFDNLSREEPQFPFTVGIVDDVTFLSLPLEEPLHTINEDAFSCKFWGLGSDGTVGANKNSAKIVGDHTDMYIQAYFEYDTKKAYGITKSHLRFSNSPIRSTYLVDCADFVACHNQSYIGKYDMVQQVKPGGIFLLNCEWSPEELEKRLPGDMKRYIAENDVRLFTIDAYKLSRELGLGNRGNIILQAAFFKLSGILPVESALSYMKEAIRKTYKVKGEKIIEMNQRAADCGITGLREFSVPAEWKHAEHKEKDLSHLPDYIRDIVIPINCQKGDTLPVSTFVGHESGTFKMGTTAYEKRGIAIDLPVWDPVACIQCNQCSYVCPHAAIRPYLLNEAEAKAAPAGFLTSEAKGKDAVGLRFTMQISTLGCTGCGSCAAVCPLKGKALVMAPATGRKEDTSAWDYGLTISDKTELFDRYSVKGSQFRQPLLEFSGACAGCGETPYAKLVTQLYGSKAYWINAIGCTMAWSAAMPSFPYTTDKKGHGPSYFASLFENQAEAGLGVFLAVEKRRGEVKLHANDLLPLVSGTKLASDIESWLAAFDDINASDPASAAMEASLQDALASGKLPAAARTLVDLMLLHKDQFTKKSVWLFGGDGWAYDIGFGGLDHVIASGRDINIFIVDTEVYSNTGGQASKATPLGASAQFAVSGKRTKKKDLARQIMTYGDVYVAQVAMGANQAQLIKALKEAESFHGPSVILAYSPCVAHGIKAGMANVQEEMKRAVSAGMWTLFRYNPLVPDDPMTIDSPPPSLPYREFLMGQTRYSGLLMKFPEIAETLFAEGEAEIRKKYDSYVKQAASLKKHSETD
ncbi:MAG: pyruvate:ferredoxin (flavodoxin) oxidoreductase [Clostridia bacterium]|nr:pyruvate:ferredoxin (flavodoxin) oxidoreductase [Clostridia bacterium]